MPPANPFFAPFALSFLERESVYNSVKMLEKGASNKK